jgi:hypothetical protein
MIAPAKSTAWYKAHYEKISLIVVWTALLISALWLLWKINHAGRALESPQWETIAIEHPEYQAQDLEQFELYRTKLASPPAWTNEQPFAVSDVRVLSVNPDVPTPVPYEAEVCPWTGYPQPTDKNFDSTGDGIPDWWYVQYGLDPFDIELASKDVDGDGFTVREEFEYETSPVDAEDHPPHVIKLRIERVRQQPFALRFQGISELAEDDIRYALNMRTQNRTFFARMGDEIEGYTLVRYEPDSRVGPQGNRVDTSRLVLERDDREIILVVNQEFSGQDFRAELVLLTDDSRYRVSVGDDLVVRNENYKVIDINRNRVLIRNENSGETIRIHPRSQEERMPTDDSIFDTF